jgi:ABC-type bacteriocin/lantibiotic exporter with double-glycine peptidase domain
VKPIRLLVLFSLFAAGFLPMLAAEAGGAWLDVPFFAQSKDGCGSASIAMVMTYWFHKEGRPVPAAADQKTIQAALYRPNDRGIRSADMQSYFQSSGFDAYTFDGTWDLLRHHLELGRPLIVALQASGPFEPLHYVVVVGMDWDRGYIFLNDPAQQKMLRISRQGFESEWRPLHHWTLLAVPRKSV